MGSLEHMVLTLRVQSPVSERRSQGEQEGEGFGHAEAERGKSEHSCDLAVMDLVNVSVSVAAGRKYHRLGGM